MGEATIEAADDTAGTVVEVVKFSGSLCAGFFRRGGLDEVEVFTEAACGMEAPTAETGVSESGSGKAVEAVTPEAVTVIEVANEFDEVGIDRATSGS